MRRVDGRDETLDGLSMFECQLWLYEVVAIEQRPSDYGDAARPRRAAAGVLVTSGTSRRMVDLDAPRVRCAVPRTEVSAGSSTAPRASTTTDCPARMAPPE